MEIGLSLAKKWKRQLTCPRAVPLFTVFLATAGSLAPQATGPLFSASPGRFSLCKIDQPAAGEPLPFRWRACWYGSELASPWAVLGGAFSSGLGQWENNPHVRRQNANDYGHRFGVYYAKRTTRDASELIAGYFNHEDPRPRSSEEAATGKRIRSALLSVLVTKDDMGSRPAFGPMAGSLAPAFVGAALYEHKDWGYALRGAGVSYGCFFAKALYREFRPEMSLLTARIRHKKPD